MDEKAIKDILKENMESPAYGFSRKTMRKIEAMQHTPTNLSQRAYNSLVGILIPVLLALLLVTSLLLFDSQPSIELTFFKEFQWPSFQINPLWIMVSAFISLGFWAWIIWEKQYQLRKN